GQDALDLGADVDDDPVLGEHDDLAGGDHAAVHGLASQLFVAGGEHVLHGDLGIGGVGDAAAAGRGAGRAHAGGHALGRGLRGDGVYRGLGRAVVFLDSGRSGGGSIGSR